MGSGRGRLMGGRGWNSEKVLGCEDGRGDEMVRGGERVSRGGVLFGADWERVMLGAWEEGFQGRRRII